MRFTVDENRCSGHAQCNASAPEVYELDELGYADPQHGEIADDQVSAARRGADACPERAITIQQD